MIVYNFEEYYSSDRYREWLKGLMEFLEDTQIRLVEYALNLNTSRKQDSLDNALAEPGEVLVGPEELANVEDPKIRRLMELYFDMESTLEDIRE